MRSGTAPAVLLLLALGLALTFAPRHAWAPGLLALIATLATFVLLPVPRAWLEVVFFGCWLSVIATAASVHLRRGVSTRLALVLSINAGAWASAAVLLAGLRLDVWEGLPAALIFLPLHWVAARYGPIPVKVLSSWIVAIAVLAATLQLLPVTPGYLPDHME